MILSQGWGLLHPLYHAHCPITDSWHCCSITERLFNGFTLQSCGKICFSVIVWGFSHSSTSPLTVQITIWILVYSHFKILASYFNFFFSILKNTLWDLLWICCVLSSYIWLFWRFHVLTRDRYFLFCAIFTYLNNHCSIFLIFPF